LKCWARAAALVWAGFAVACGGGGTTPTSSATPAGGDPAKLVQLDSGNFDALVLASARPGLVEFHSPT
jgi:hypothetical protein